MAGASLRCFFTVHWSAARTIAARYFSGKPGGSAISSRIRAISFVAGLRSHVIEISSPSLGIFLSWQKRSA